MTDGKIRELTDEQLTAYVDEFYRYFANGYAFEDFLNGSATRTALRLL